MSALTLVNRAVAIAVRVSCDFAPPDVRDLGAYAQSVGKRIQGTYGADLRRMAELEPQSSAEDLYRAVILPKEFPWLAAENPHAEELANAGARDRARKRRWISDLEDRPPIPADLAERVAQAKTAAKIGAAQLQARPRPERVVIDRSAPNVVPKEIYESLNPKHRMESA